MKKGEARERPLRVGGPGVVLGGLVWEIPASATSFSSGDFLFLGAPTYKTSCISLCFSAKLSRRGRLAGFKAQLLVHLLKQTPCRRLCWLSTMSKKVG